MVVPVIAIIGAGNIGRCLMGGLINNHYPADKIWLTNPSIDKLTVLKDQFAIHTTTDNIEAAKVADILIFAVKPTIVPTICSELAAIVQMRQSLIISAAAGISTLNINHWLGDNVPVVRCMPNVAAFIGCGATALFANTFVTKDQRDQVETILRTLGITVWLAHEKLMNPVTALSGCGPAYFFLLMDALEQAGTQLGLPPDTARLLTLQTAYGAGRMALESDKTAAELIVDVASPGGSTVEALRVLKENNIYDLIATALKAANLRAEERELLFVKNLKN